MQWELSVVGLTIAKRVLPWAAHNALPLRFQATQGQDTLYYEIHPSGGWLWRRDTVLEEERRT
jgi:hypothetical protein